LAICCCQEEQELTTLPEHLSSLPVFSGVHVTQSLVLCVFCRSLFILSQLNNLLVFILFCNNNKWLVFISINLETIQGDQQQKIVSLIIKYTCNSIMSIFSFMCVFCRSLFILFRLDIVLSALLRFMDSDYPFGIFKLFSVTTQK
jgi:hypothetical protein